VEFEGADRHCSDRSYGYSLFVSRNIPFPDMNLQCSSAIGTALQGSSYPPSYYHVEPIPGENRPLADRGNGLRYDDQLVVLHTTLPPAVLIEAGVIVHRQSRRMLAMQETRENLSQAIAAGFATCLPSQTETQ
jgi:N-acetylmuramoyl-L-alanine amidase